MTVLDAIYVCNVDTIIDTLKSVLANFYEIVKNLENTTKENTNMTLVIITKKFKKKLGERGGGAAVYGFSLVLRTTQSVGCRGMLLIKQVENVNSSTLWYYWLTLSDSDV